MLCGCVALLLLFFFFRQVVYANGAQAQTCVCRAMVIGTRGGRFSEIP